MAGFHIIWLSIALAALTSFLSAAAPPKPELATEVCKNTTDFDFCRASVYSDQRAPTADQYELIDIIYRKAYANATDTKDYIASNLKTGGTESQSLEKCLANYNDVIENLSSMLNDLNSETYYHLDVRSLEVEASALDCKKVLHRDSIVYDRNENMLKLSNICYVVSKLFPSN